MEENTKHVQDGRGAHAVVLKGPGMTRAQHGGELGPGRWLSPDVLVEDLERQAEDTAYFYRRWKSIC